ncbi:hypothetical protein EW146_g4300 [Bondarzewia mesenterica]|uniref:Uncharacterized protein n=1 Tax=Bondarzewia mesenterica TaxID=1095465 RepID=A0A4V3XF66_9AGAM|nr:hypothetical protein EW146_g4300 [Bondarzewia mesenterica]
MVHQYMVLAGNGIIAVSSQTARPSGSQNTEDEVEESNESARAHEELQDRAVAGQRRRKTALHNAGM